MNNQILQVKLEQRVNKLSSSDYGNIECWMKAEAFNKAMDAWVRRQLEGINQTKTGAEGSVRRIDDLQVLLTTWTDTWTDQGLYVESNSFPDDYMEWCRISAKAQDQCKDCYVRPLVIFEGNEADVDLYLADINKQPDYNWATTFSTIAGNKFKIWTNEQFNVIEPVLTYYRKPVHIQLANCTDPDTGNFVTDDVECELPDNVIELIIDEAAAILSIDLNDYQKAQTLSAIEEHNT